MGQTWNGNVLNDAGNVASDVVSWLSGPPGDPGRIRQVASQVEALADRFDRDRRGLNEAVDELTRSWQGDGAGQFHQTWYEGGGSQAPATVLTSAHAQLTGFVTNLRDYADKLEQAQNEHWIQMGIMAALTVVNAVQLGADPATDAAEVATGVTLATVGTMTIQGAFIGLSSGVIAQLGADVLDHLDSQFDQTGDHATSWFNPDQALLSGLEGGAGGALLGGTGLLFRGGSAPAIAADEGDLAGGTPELSPAPKIFDASDTGSPVPSRFEPTTNASPDLSTVNGDPNPAPQNCSACVKAVDARMTGDPQATAGPMKSGVSFADIESEWGGPVAQRGWSSIQTDMTQAGSGSRGVMILTSPTGAHIVNVVNDNGVVRILDGQIGKSTDGFSDYVQGTNFAGPNTQTYFRLTYSPPPPPPSP